MIRPFGLLAVLVALLLGASPGTALAAGQLRATIAQATPTPVGEELSEDPGLPDGEDDEAGTSEAEEDDDADAGSGGNDDEAAGGAGDLPNTGAEPLLVALMGLGLVGTGLGLRRRIAHAGRHA